MKALLSCFPHIIKFTCLKCIGQWVFSIFIKKCICHNLILGYFHHPERNPIPISHHSRSPNSTPPPQSALSNPRPTFCLWIYSFVLPNNTWLYHVIHCWWTLGCFHFAAILKRLLWTFVYKFLCPHHFKLSFDGQEGRVCIQYIIS